MPESFSHADVERLIKGAVEDERAACAAVARELLSHTHGYLAREIALWIEARGNQDAETKDKNAPTEAD